MGLFKSKPQQQTQKQEPAAVPKNGSKMDRVNETDKAILELKATMRKLRTYQDKLRLQETELV